MNPKQQLVEKICEHEKASGVVLVIFHAGMERAEFVSASRDGFEKELPAKLEKVAKQCGEQFTVIHSQAN